MSSTGYSRPSGPFFTQVDHRFSIKCFSKQAMNCFSISKFEVDLTTGSKVMAKKLTFIQPKVNFSAITLEPIV